MSTGPAAPVEPGAHAPVMLGEVLGLLAPRDGAIYVDGTFGAGGYSRALLEAAACTVLAIDRDPDALPRAAHLTSAFGGRFAIAEGRFGDMDALFAQRLPKGADGVTLDLGVSSPQLDDDARGFSFRLDGPLDMRMEKSGPSAGDIVNTASEGELADIIFTLGDERFARRIARAIVAARREKKLTRTSELAELVRGAVPAAARHDASIHPATRTFQALRIHVNDELGELDRGLLAAETLLAPNGVLAVVSFHSLEDRRVKAFLRSRSGGAPRASRHLPTEAVRAAAPSFELITRRALRPSDNEIARNPRARSARLRAGRRTPAPAWPRGDTSWRNAA